MSLILLGLLALPIVAAAQVANESTSELGTLSFVDESLVARPVIETVDDIQGSLRPSVVSGWADMRSRGEWSATVDKRTGSVDMVEGSGLPWIAGRGNSLAVGTETPSVASLERISRSFLPRVAPMLGVDVKSLKLDRDRSGNPIDYLWYVDYNVEIDGLAVDNARVVFRVNHGNLIQFGTENLPSPGAKAPVAKLGRNEALSALSAYIGGFRAADSFVDNGSQHLLPTAVADSRFNDGFELGKGRGLTRVWQFVFRRDGDNATWRGRVDAASGKILELRDINDYASAQVTGGVKFLGVPTTRPLPFADVTGGGFTNSAGVYNYVSGTVSSTLNGQYIKINDNCGAISQSSDMLGNILFGTSAGTDCTTPGTGGAGNTHSARTQFYHANRAKEIARGWITRPWLTAQLTANVNIALTCNAFWNGSTINFYRSGGGCGNTGDIEGVSLHEYGHGLDTNDGNGSSTENGTGETYGDFTAALATHTSCIGAGFRATNCGGYGDTCTACTGVRDIDWAKHNSNAAHTVANFTQTICPTSGSGYIGPCGKEGHCESYVSSEALYDLAARDLPSPGTGAAWTTVDRLWYLSRATATSAFTCTPSGSPWTSNGCGAGSNWKTMRAVDDDDGNLANGTPHSASLYAAFNRHGIACTTDPGANTNFQGCTPPAVPTLSVVAGDNQVTATVSGSAGVYDLYRTENGCNSGFIKINNDAAGPVIIDNNVANGFTYYYQITAHTNGNEACATAPSTCMSVTPSAIPCVPPATPTGVTATQVSMTQINVSWGTAAGATEYHVYRSATPGGPYTLVNTTAGTTFSDTTLVCGTTYYYMVRAGNSASCESPSSTEVTASTVACPPCTTTTLYDNNFDSASGMSDWTSGTFGGTPFANWRGVQACTAHTGANIFRYGGTTCTADYTANEFAFASPNGGPGIVVPAGSRTSRLSFWHRRAFETGFDGGTVALSVDGVNYEYVPTAAILSGTSYNGVIAPDCSPSPDATGAAVFTGTNATFTNTTIDLDAACNVASGMTDGCGGRTLRIAFTTVSDCTIFGDGWFLDDVNVSSCVPDAAPVSLDFHTATPCRLVDTRNAVAPNGGPALVPGATRSFVLTGSCGIPSTAKAVSVNLTVVNAGSAGDLSLFPTGIATPVARSISFAAGQTRANNAQIGISAGGAISVFSSATAPVDFVLDVNGWFE